jgi:hypothetical protein
MTPAAAENQAVPLSPTLGAPDVYFAPDVPPRMLELEPMDVVAFAGVAPRGPAWEPVDDPTLIEAGITRARSVAVAVDNWDDYIERFGGFQAPGLLPHAVAAFFAQGGRRAYVVRIIHDELATDGSERRPLGCAHLDLVAPPGPADTGLQQPEPEADPPLLDLGGQPVRLRARNEGTWGERLAATLSFSPRPLAATLESAAVLRLDPGSRIPPGTLLRLTFGAGGRELRTVSGLRWRGRADDAGRDLLATLDRPVAAGVTVTAVEQVDGELVVADGDPERPRLERFVGLGFAPGHPRFLPQAVTLESRLVEVVGATAGIQVLDPLLPAVASRLMSEPEELRAADRWHLVTPADVFGRVLEGDEAGTDGLDALLGCPEVATIVVPDLYSPVDLPVSEPVDLAGVFAGPDFAPSVERPPVRHPAPPALPLVGLHLDPTSPDGLEAIVFWQQRLVAVAERLRCVALLDVPPGLRHQQVLGWRARHDSAFAAAYHPWLRAAAAVPAGPLIDLPPSAAAAGIIARCERREGLTRGPAGEPASGVVDVAERLDDDRHGVLHQQGVNVFRPEPGGIWLTGARTLSTDRWWRQLSVRRLVLLIERAVARQLQWTVFEPNGQQLRAGLRRMLDQLLAELFAQGAFAGATPDESWFVHVAMAAEVAAESDRGQLVVEVGVAPSEPTEFIVVRVSLDTEGAVETHVRIGSGMIDRD